MAYQKRCSLFWAFTVITALTGEDGNLIGFSEVTRDITESKKAEDQKLEYERRFVNHHNLGDNAWNYFDTGVTVFAENIETCWDIK